MVLGGDDLWRVKRSVVEFENDDVDGGDGVVAAHERLAPLKKHQSSGVVNPASCHQCNSPARGEREQGKTRVRTQLLYWPSTKGKESTPERKGGQAG